MMKTCTLRTMNRLLISLFCCLEFSVFALEKPISKPDVEPAPKLAIILNSGSASVTRIDMYKREVIDDFPIGK